MLLRTLLTYIFITFAIRLMGKRQIGDMQPNELVVTLLISELAAISLQDLGQPMAISIVSIFILVFLEIAISVITMKWAGIKRFFTGKPIVLIDNGIIRQDAMKTVRMSSTDLVQLLRNQGVFDISEVYCAVLEVNGNLSVQLKAENQPVTEAKIENSLPMLVVSDGHIVSSAMEFLNISRETLEKHLLDKKTKMEDVYFMTLDRGGKSIIIKKDNAK